MGPSLGVQVGLDDDDDIQRLRELLVEQLCLVDTGLDRPFHSSVYEGLLWQVRVSYLAAILAPGPPSGIGAGVGEVQGKVLLMIIGADLPTPSGKPQESARQVVAYFGTYSVDEGAKTITYTAERATIPAFDGLARKATVTVTGEELRQSSAPVTGPQGTFTPQLVMRRAQ